MLRRDSDVVLPCAYIIDVLMLNLEFQTNVALEEEWSTVYFSYNWTGGLVLVYCCWVGLQLVVLVLLVRESFHGFRLLDSLLYERCLLVGHE